MSSQRQLLNDGLARRVNVARVRIDQIHVEPGFQPPETPEEFAARVQAMVTHLSEGGMLPAIEVRERAEGGVWLVDGHGRHAAYQRAHELGLPVADDDGHVYIETRLFVGNDADRLIRLATSAEGRTLSPLQLASVYKRLQGLGKKPGEIAARVGKSVDHVDQVLTLANANTDVQNMVQAGEVSATVAVKAVKKAGEKAGAELKEHLESAKAAGKTKVTDAVVNAEKKAAKAREQADLLADAQMFRWLVEHGQLGIGLMGNVEINFEKPEAINGSEDLRVIVKAAMGELA